MKHKASHEPLPEDDADRRSFRWRPSEVLDLLKASAKEFVEDKSPKQAAALAYYTLFAMGPLLVLAIGIAALAFGAEAAREAVLSQVSKLTGEAGAEGLTALLTGADRERVGILGTVIGLVVLLFSAGAVFAQLKDALNRIWEVEAKKAVGWKAKLATLVRKNFLSFAGVVGTGFLLLVTLVVSAGLAAMGDYVSAAFPGAELVLQVVNFLVSLVVVGFVFAAMFKFIPDARVAWRDVLVGGLVTALLFVVGQFALGYYLGSGPLSSRYGAAGAVIVLLVWVYYSGMIVFFGAQLTQVYANRYGSHVRESDDARTLEEAVVEEQSEPENEGTKRAPPRGSRRPQA
ncbi:MAG TPA: YihY/virulence factor BrkB family protein [Candidatus Thermoplasmatota archaeon]|nr:YihY/virulence factor BrkB family protein [Candidatus Thermoplasmatota archaeon]